MTSSMWGEGGGTHQCEKGQHHEQHSMRMASEMTEKHKSASTRLGETCLFLSQQQAAPLSVVVAALVLIKAVALGDAQPRQGVPHIQKPAVQQQCS